ncbi:hypothetical protein [Rhodococcus sp. USK13]|uniref:hypothetical protein n=1 Tax=Rhodococcus sp. USK13 TaxID=2806442 RepID=UPI001BD0413B|nr:hypothetical protein [Rhodococcus sp. USK13]
MIETATSTPRRVSPYRIAALIAAMAGTILILWNFGPKPSNPVRSTPVEPVPTYVKSDISTQCTQDPAVMRACLDAGN